MIPRKVCVSGPRWLIALALIVCVLLFGPPLVAIGQVTIEALGGRIVDGVLTDISDHPWQVAIATQNAGAKLVLCGGAIIEKRWILTAAHCFGKQGKNAVVHVKSGVTKFLAEGVWVKAVRVIPHFRYKNDSNGYAIEDDIALVMLGSDLNGAAIPKASSSTTLEGEALELTGWGTISDSSSIPSPDLRKVELAYVDNKSCQQAYPSDRVTTTMLCAGAKDVARGPCYGDSGGPLVIRTGKAAGILVGIVSAGKKCDRSRAYGIYTRVSEYNEWIAKTISSAL